MSEEHRQKAHAITWGDFKRIVEAGGVEDTDELAYIDIGDGDAISIERFQAFSDGKWKVSVG